MNSANQMSDIMQLMIEQLQVFEQVIEQLQAQVNELNSQMPTSASMLIKSDEENMKSVIMITQLMTIMLMKFKKLSDSLMFNED